MTIKGNPENVSKPETFPELITAWKNSLSKLDQEKSATVAGYIVGDLTRSNLWAQEKLGDPQVEELFETAADLEIDNFKDPRERDQMWEHIKKLMDKLEDKYPENPKS